MRRITTLVAVALSLALAPAAGAADGVIVDGVTIGGVAVGGLTADGATTVVRDAFEGGLVRVNVRSKLYQPSVKSLGGRVVGLAPAVEAALVRTTPGDVVLAVSYSDAAVAALVADLARRNARGAADARWGWIGRRPVAVAEKPGSVVDLVALRRALVAALQTPAARTVAAEFRSVKPRRTRGQLPPAIVISRGAHRLHVYRYAGGETVLWRRFGVAVGAAEFPTPRGLFRIIDKQRHPWWYPPDSDWAKDAEPIPPGPSNPLGTRWMGISSPAVGIHGTPNAASIGYSASHGCIRMKIPDAEWVFQRVRIGSPVRIY